MLFSKLKTFDDSFSLSSSKLVSNFFDGGKEIVVPEVKIILELGRLERQLSQKENLITVFNQTSDDFGVVLSTKPSSLFPDNPEEMIIEEIFSHQTILDS